MNKRAGLGKGLEALFGNTEDVSAEVAENEVKQEIDVADLVPNPYQPRKVFEPEKMKELVDSVKQHGVIQPLIVRKSGNRYEIVAGERRWRAAKTAGLKVVPIVIRDYDEEAMMEVAMIENIQRHDLNPLEEAEGIKAMMDKLQLTQADAAKKLGRSRTAVTNILRLLNLPAKIREYISKEELTLGQVRPLLVIEDEAKQLLLAQTIITKGWSVRKVEDVVKEFKEGRDIESLIEDAPIQEKKENSAKKTKASKIKESPDIFCADFQNKMMSVLGTKVKVVKKTETSGKIEIEYYSLDDLERIYELLEEKAQALGGSLKKIQKLNV